MQSAEKESRSNAKQSLALQEKLQRELNSKMAELQNKMDYFITTQ